MVRVYNGLDLPQGVARREENWINQRLQVACVGVICEQKNQMELLRAQCVLHKRGIDIDTWFVGTCNDKAYLNSIQDYANDNGLVGMTHFVGHVDKVFEVLQKMNLGVVTAHDEAFGRVTVEYMLMKMPVIVSRSGASPELVKSGQTGLIYELGDVESLADDIESYCFNPDLLVSQGEAAFSDATERFSAGSNMEHIYNQIVEVLSSK
jgi:glycosyltransferase involved in cell wall biosynthesis